MTERIYLYPNQDKAGFDDNGNTWVKFEVDYLALQEEGECCVCGKSVSEGWLCLDGGEEACHDCVELHKAPESDEERRSNVTLALARWIDTETLAQGVVDQLERIGAEVSVDNAKRLWLKQLQPLGENISRTQEL